jgi:DHA2 family multidrug resistance protein
MIMQILDTTIANVALPHMQTSLGATRDTITWVLTSYIVASAIAIPRPAGSRPARLAQPVPVRGRRLRHRLDAVRHRVSLEEMVLFRILQGITAAFINPLSQTAMLDINPPEAPPRRCRSGAWA